MSHYSVDVDKLRERICMALIASNEGWLTGKDIAATAGDICDFIAGEAEDAKIPAVALTGAMAPFMPELGSLLEALQKIAAASSGKVISKFQFEPSGVRTKCNPHGQGYIRIEFKGEYP